MHMVIFLFILIKDLIKILLEFSYTIDLKLNKIITLQIQMEKASFCFCFLFFPLIFQIGMYLGVTVPSRSRSVKDKNFHSFTVISKK